VPNGHGPKINADKMFETLRHRREQELAVYFDKHYKVIRQQEHKKLFPVTAFAAFLSSAKSFSRSRCSNSNLALRHKCVVKSNFSAQRIALNLTGEKLMHVWLSMLSSTAFSTMLRSGTTFSSLAPAANDPFTVKPSPPPLTSSPPPPSTPAQTPPHVSPAPSTPSAPHQSAPPVPPDTAPENSRQPPGTRSR
jgi:hypothetical protein